MAIAAEDLEELANLAEEAQSEEDSPIEIDGAIIDISQYLDERKQVFGFLRKPTEEVAERHALKLKLGKRQYSRFYVASLLKSIKEEYEEQKTIPKQVIEELNEQLNENRFSIPIYETVLQEDTLNVKLGKVTGKGGLYKVRAFLPQDVKLTNFVKQYATKKGFRKAIQLQKRLCKLRIHYSYPVSEYSSTYSNKHLNMVTAPLHTDADNLLVSESFLEGKTLEELLKGEGIEKIETIRHTLDDWAMLITQADGIKNWQHYENGHKTMGFADYKGRPLLEEIDYTSSFINLFLFGTPEFAAVGKRKRKRMLSRDPELQDLLKLYEQEISESLNSAERSFVHGDLHLNNILISKGKTRFLDWESAKYTTPLFDIAKLIRKAQINDPEQEKEIVDSAFDSLYFAKYEAELQFGIDKATAEGNGEHTGKLKQELAELRTEHAEEKAGAKGEFWQNYLKFRTHEDLRLTASYVQRAKQKGDNKDSWLAGARWCFDRAINTVDNLELKKRLFAAGQRFFSEEFEEAEKIMRSEEFTGPKVSSHSWASMGSNTEFYELERRMKPAKRMRALKTGLKIGLPTIAALVALGFLARWHVDKNEIETLSAASDQQYSKIIKIENRIEPIMVPGIVNPREANYPLVYDPTHNPGEKWQRELGETLVKSQLETRADLYDGKPTNCFGGPGGGYGECLKKMDPVRAYSGRFAEINEEMIRSLILTSDWMNSRGKYGYWGDRRWVRFAPGQTECNSPIIYYDANDLSFTKCEQVQDPQTNILFTYKRLNDMLRSHPQFEDAIANLFAGESKIDYYKSETQEDNYWRYSQHSGFPSDIKDFVEGFRIIYGQMKDGR